jgi:hypothetical protein
MTSAMELELNNIKQVMLGRLKCGSISVQSLWLLKDREGTLTQVLKITNKLTATMDMAAAMESARAAVQELLDCERVTLFLVFHSLEQLRWVFSQESVSGFFTFTHHDNSA